MAQVPISGNWLKAKDLKPGDTCIIKDEADWVIGSWNGQETKQYACTVDFNGEERTLKFTKASRKELVVFGTDSKEWIGKKIELFAVDIMIDGEMKKTIIAKPWGSGADQTALGTKEPLTADQQAKVDAGQPWDE